MRYFMLEKSTELHNKFWEIFSKQDRNKIDEFKLYMDKFAINFNLYKDGNFIEQSLPFDVIPRIISKQEFSKIEKGLQQRVQALNLFLEDIYTDSKIVKEGIIPQEFVEQASGYLKEFVGFSPSKKNKSPYKWN